MNRRFNILRRWFSRANPYHALPTKLRASIKRQQDGSERLIGWIQLAIISVFTALYLAAPKTALAGVEFEPVPWFLSAYFVFTCLRLWLAHKISLPGWFLVLSIVMDMALLLGLIWSFHIQYLQPPSFYLKAPTLLYVFIFIALRGLRFEPGYVVLAGVIASSGWLILMAYALMGSVGDSAITRDYVEYLTSNSVLLGGEIDKVISILVVTAVLSVAIARARALLIQSIVESSAVENLSHFVPEAVSSKIATTEGPLINAQTETREASILFADLVSFTSMSEQLSPEELIRTVNEYFALIAEPVQRNRGALLKFIGDAFLATYNLPASNPDHANCAVATALEIQQRLRAHQFSTRAKLQARIGINSGKVVGGFAGTPERLEYTLYGDHVNIAARLEQLNKSRATSVLVSARTKALCDPQRFAFTPHGEEILRGRQTAIEVFAPSWKE